MNLVSYLFLVVSSVLVHLQFLEVLNANMQIKNLTTIEDLHPLILIVFCVYNWNSFVTTVIILVIYPFYFIFFLKTWRMKYVTDPYSGEALDERDHIQINMLAFVKMFIIMVFCISLNYQKQKFLIISIFEKN